MPCPPVTYEILIAAIFDDLLLTLRTVSLCLMTTQTVFPFVVHPATSYPSAPLTAPLHRFQRWVGKQLKEASRLSGVSTASLGKFDERLPGEKPGERQLAGKKRKFMPLVNSGERPLASTLVDRIVRERADDILDVGRAIGKVEV